MLPFALARSFVSTLISLEQGCSVPSHSDLQSSAVLEPSFAEEDCCCRRLYGNIGIPDLSETIGAGKQVSGEQPEDTECAFCAYFGHEPSIATSCSRLLFAKLSYFSPRALNPFLRFILLLSVES